MKEKLSTYGNKEKNLDTKLSYEYNKSNTADIYDFLLSVDNDFMPILSEVVSLPEYATKLFNKAERFEFFYAKKLVALVAAYFNNETRICFITCVAVLSDYRKKHLASALLEKCINMAYKKKMNIIKLEVHPYNTSALNLYKQIGFIECVAGHNTTMLTMCKQL